MTTFQENAWIAAWFNKMKANMLTAIWYQIWHNRHHHYSQLCNGTHHVQRQETSCKAHQCNNTAQCVQNSYEQSTWQCAQELHIPHRTVCTVLHPDDYTNCYQHAALSQWQCSLLLLALQSSWYSHITNQCVCLECWGETIPHYMTVTSAHYTPPKSPTANVKPQSNLPTRHTQNSHRPVMFRRLCTKRKIIMSPICDKASQRLHLLRRTRCNVLCSVSVKCSTCHKVCTWQSAPTENTKPASTLSNETYVLNMFIETATCFS